jgi:hypothetical protein
VSEAAVRGCHTCCDPGAKYPSDTRMLAWAAWAMAYRDRLFYLCAVWNSRFSWADCMKRPDTRTSGVMGVILPPQVAPRA